MPEIVERQAPSGPRAALERAGVHPVLARLLAARGVTCAEELDLRLEHLLPPAGLLGLDRMARLLADAIGAGERLLIVGDYDCDGATACATGVLALRAFGAQVDYLMPNRFEFGYGLTPEIVRVAAQRRPHVLITVDNGIASVDGVREANALGMRVIVTDHHLPGERLPEAACIVNPNQAGCSFSSKHLAGVGVMFYAMLALRGELRRRGAFAGREVPNLGALLDLVALGTVADVVRLDYNNRILVEQGLRRMRAGRARMGIRALLEVCGREPDQLCAHDLGFLLGPRVNAAGRLTDITLGIECLLSDDAARAHELARQLHELNRERRHIEADMQATALAHLEEIDADGAFGLALYRRDWHQGVIGILAARIRERFHRPVIAFADGLDGELKGSGRSIAGLHLRDALDLVDKRQPGLILRFGGHAAAAGLSIRTDSFASFRQAFDAVLRELLSPADLQERIETDGVLEAHHIGLDLAESLRRIAWGQGFPPPRFVGEFRVADQRVVGGAHLKLRLAVPGTASGVDAMLFRCEARLPARIRCVYRLEVNEWSGLRAAQLVVEHWQELA
ncbi:MAG: single-stranded-DNA-specific exonuclease RecJ [Burkholderiales bacterium]|nr:single-stranded-DNA-specific exonuclease RecJ [Burkholderiales bacterium]